MTGSLTIWLATVIEDGEIVTEFVSGCQSNAEELIIEWASDNPEIAEWLAGSDTATPELDRWLGAASEAGFDVFIRPVISLGPDGRPHSEVTG